ncbi:MAG: archaemetzincin family Zn-dependent metalloprotease [Ignavibacteriae bacterium]|nr:archaemetzincin family Zn-dependent metalloprotease [Ignavibacteriota bacterium]
MNIYFAPIKFSNKTVLKKLQRELSGIFSVNIDSIKLDIDLSEAYSPERKQYYSTKIIEFVISQTGYADGTVLIITELDLYVPVLTFVFGEAQLNGKHSIVSVCRLHEEFYTGVTNDELFYERTKKEVLHELGHNFGLLHCFDWDCVMHSSNSIEEVDIKGSFYCNHCYEEIKMSKDFHFKK